MLVHRTAAVVLAVGTAVQEPVGLVQPVEARQTAAAVVELEPSEQVQEQVAEQAVRLAVEQELPMVAQCEDEPTSARPKLAEPDSSAELGSLPAATVDQVQAVLVWSDMLRILPRAALAEELAQMPLAEPSRCRFPPSMRSNQ